ncbi:MAG: ribokinase [Defluviitaleaceae bacterium]|nr:ribokinase [Defluviitaleaceae bacterium]MCL2273890.1 ribokinase [Defluviitaleaceae bacterium]
MKPKILCIGSVNMDLLLLTQRIPRAGETLVSEKYQFSAGGKGANQAVAASLLGGDVSFAGKVGDDEFGEHLLNTLQSKNINTANVNTSKSNPSGFAVIMLEDGNNRIISHLAANADITTAEIDRALTAPYHGLIINFEISQEIVIHACTQARKRGIPFIVDTGPAMDFPLEKIRGARILSPNETEAEALTGVKPSDEASYTRTAEILQRRADASHIVLKLGENGAFHYHGEKGKHFAPHIVKVVDTTAAGDVFTAAMAVQYLQHGEIAKAIRYANAAGALTVTKAGAQESIPTAREVEEIL